MAKLPKRPAVGDLVTLVNRQQVVRVGYPKSVRQYAADLDTPEMTAAVYDLLDKAMGRHVARPNCLPEGRNRPGWLRLILHTLAVQVARADGFGGHDRTIHVRPMDPFVAAFNQFKVVDVRRCVIGRYYAPWCSSGDGWTVDPDYEPGGLENAKHCRLLRIEIATVGDLAGKRTIWDQVSEYCPPGDFDRGLWVREEDVQLATREG